MNTQPPPYTSSTNPPTPILLTLYNFSYIRPSRPMGRRIGRLLKKRNDIAHLTPYTTNTDFATSLIERAATLFGMGEDLDKVAFTMFLRAEGVEDVQVDEENWGAVCGFLGAEGVRVGARLVMAMGPVVEDVGVWRRLGGLVLQAKRRVVGWELPGRLA